MASDRHTIFGAALVGIIVIACIAGLVITGGPGEARKEREDNARLNALADTAWALACYKQVNGSVPDDLSRVEAEVSDASSETRKKKGCASASYSNDPVTGDPFTLRRDEAGAATHICADFATTDTAGSRYGYRASRDVVPDLYEARETAGEHCFALNLDAELD